MALTNAYCTLSDLKNSLAIEDIQDDTALEAAIMTASRMVDDYTGRFFYKDGTNAVPAVRYYTPQDWYNCNTDDFITISELATDNNFDQTWSTVWATSDYLVEPVNNPSRKWPLTRIISVGAYLFPIPFPQSVKVSGIFGWSAIPHEVAMATKIQASRLFVRRQSPFGVAGSPDLGTIRLSAKLDPDVEALIRPFKKLDGLAR